VAAPGELVRISLDATGGLALGAGPGRGAWVCGGGPQCVDRSIRRGGLTRALRAEPSPDVQVALRARFVHTAMSGEALAELCEDGGSGRIPGATKNEGP
jgi:predicted RNA-binding protein YlxR (DUF448 family)